jgi:hypothetical protein
MLICACLRSVTVVMSLLFTLPLVAQTRLSFRHQVCGGGLTIFWPGGGEEAVRNV